MNHARPLPSIGSPATKALLEVGGRDLDDDRRVGLEHLETLHGVGPKTIRVLRAALEE